MSAAAELVSDYDPVMDQPESASARLSPAVLLRWVGAAALLVSGLVFLLQGIDSVDSQLRDWVYLAMIAALGAASVVSLRGAADVLGARLSLALAVGLLPVQVAQLAGAIEEGLLGTMLYSGVATAALFLPVAYAAFSVLARPSARVLTLLFFGSNALLLLPGREVFAGAALMGVLGAGALLLELFWLRRAAHFRTVEGVAARLVLLLPLAIALGRFAFQFGDAEGVAAIALMSGVLLMRVPGVFTESSVRDWLAAIGLTLVLVGLGVLTAALADDWHRVLLLTLSVGLCFGQSLNSSAANQWRTAGAVLAVPLAGSLLEGTSLAFGAVLVLPLGIVLVMLGVHWRQRATACSGTLLTLCALGILICEALSGLSGHLWIGLGVLGLIGVTASSFVERYGSVWLQQTKRLRAQVAAWD